MVCAAAYAAGLAARLTVVSNVYLQNPKKE